MGVVICEECGLERIDGCRKGGIPRPDGSWYCCPNEWLMSKRRSTEAQWPVPVRYAQAELGRVPDDFDSHHRSRLEKAHAAARQWLDAFVAGESRGCLIIQGPAGTGKTWLLSAVYREAWARRTPTIWAEVPSIISRLRGTFARDSEIGPEDLLEPLREAGLLMLDDVGMEMRTPFAESEIWNLANERYTAGLPVAVTTNKTAAELDRSDAWRSILDRWSHGATVIRLHGSSLRQPVEVVD